MYARSTTGLPEAPLAVRATALIKAVERTAWGVYLCRKKQTIRQFKWPDLYGARTAHWYRPSISSASHRRPDSAA